MLSAVLLTTMTFAVAAPEVHELWQGTLDGAVATQKKKKGRTKVEARTRNVTLRLTRKGSNFVGEWTEEGKGTLEISGTVTGSQARRSFTAAPTRVKKGNWAGDIVRDLSLQGEIVKDEMSGTVFGSGAKRVRAATFVLRKQQASPGDKP
jgi:hypothetical protein